MGAFKTGPIVVCAVYGTEQPNTPVFKSNTTFEGALCRYGKWKLILNEG